MSRPRVALVPLLGTIAVGAATAEPLVTDRPDFVESSSTVGAGVFQIETSVALDRVERGGTDERTFSTPTLLRFGFAEDWEARLETDGATRVRLDPGLGARVTEDGFSDVSVGVKRHLTDGDPGTPRPSIGVLLHADLAVGSSAFGGRGTRPSLRASAEWDLSEALSLGVMPGLIRDSDGTGERFTAGILAVVLGRAWTDRAGTFVEVAAHRLAADRHGGDVVTLDAGGTYLLGPDLQLDLALAWGLNRDSPDFGATVGLSARF